MRKIVLIVHNVRSCHNVGSLLRTAEGLGVKTVYLTGYTPYPRKEQDERLPHIANKIHKQIQKTALDAEKQVHWEQQTDIFELIDRLKTDGYKIAAVEQSTNATQLHKWAPSEQTALLVGREVEGVEPEVINACDLCLEIPMFGKKESFNVVQAAAMAMYHCRFA